MASIYSKADYPLPIRRSLTTCTSSRTSSPILASTNSARRTSFDDGDLTLRRLSELELPEWQPTLNLARARLFSDWANNLQSRDPARAKAMRKQAIELFNADQTPEQHGSRLRAKLLATLVEEQ